MVEQDAFSFHASLSVVLDLFVQLVDVVVVLDEIRFIGQDSFGVGFGVQEFVMFGLADAHSHFTEVVGLERLLFQIQHDDCYVGIGYLCSLFFAVEENGACVVNAHFDNFYSNVVKDQEREGFDDALSSPAAYFSEDAMVDGFLFAEPLHWSSHTGDQQKHEDQSKFCPHF